MGMNRDVYSFLLKTYGRHPGWWISLAFGATQVILLRVVTTIILARLMADLAAGDLEHAKFNILLQLAVSIAGLLCRLGRDLVGTSAENKIYLKLTLDYYRKLTGK